MKTIDVQEKSVDNTSKKKKRVLLTNDDGYSAKGINILFDALSFYFEVIICAPLNNQSGQSHAITLRTPLKTYMYDRGYKVDGTPVDCVYLGLAHLVQNPDLIISGINHGYNLGDDFHYSGTVAAAREAAFYHKKSIAVSMGQFKEQMAKDHAKFLSKFIFTNFDNFTPGVVTSINLPNKKSSQVTYTKLGKRDRSCLRYTQHQSESKDSYTIGKLNEGSERDFQSIADHNITCTSIDYHQDILGVYRTEKFV